MYAVPVSTGDNYLPLVTMELIKKTLFVSLVLGLLFSCKSSRLTSEVRPRDKKILSQYIEIYRNQKEKKDTLHLFKNVFSLKIDLEEFKIGKMKNGIKYGKWYYYLNVDSISIECYSIEKINKNTQKSKTIWTNSHAVFF